MTKTIDEITRSVRHRILEHPLADQQQLRDIIAQIVPLVSDQTLDEYVAHVHAELFGLGAIEPLLADPQITDICVNGPGPVWIERYGSLQQSGVTVDREALETIIERMAAQSGQRADRLSPIVDIRLLNGARAHVTMEPVAIDGPYVAIRRFASTRLGLSEFCDLAMLEELVRIVQARTNVVVCGSTGAGKTTLLGALAEWFDPADRVITIEDTAELNLRHPHVIRLETRTPNAEGIGGVDMRQLVRASLRLRPDRLVIGEVRGAEAYDMLQALNTGHAGSFTTVHANDGIAALARLQTLCMLADASVTADIAHEMVLSAIGAIVVVKRLGDGKRVVDQLFDVQRHELWVRNADNVAQYTVERLLGADPTSGWEDYA